MKDLWPFIARVWSHIWTRDNRLHTVLGAAVAAWVVLLLWLAPVFMPAFFAMLYLYLREVGQVQAGYFGHDFRRGWTLYVSDQRDAGWRAFHRQMEWVVPSLKLWAANLIAAQFITLHLILVLD